MEEKSKVQQDMLYIVRQRKMVNNKAVKNDHKSFEQTKFKNKKLKEEKDILL